MKLKTSKEVIKYFVKIKGFSKRCTITIVEGALRQVGDFERNAQFKENGQNLGKDGFIEKIYKTQIYRNGKFEECKL